MVYVDSWDEFVERSVQLFRADPNAVRRRRPIPSPLPRVVLLLSVCPILPNLFVRVSLQTRYVMKYRHCEGKLVLKVTDDREVLPCPSCIYSD
jgi:signal recognition particle subunit SRP9